MNVIASRQLALLHGSAKPTRCHPSVGGDPVKILIIISIFNCFLDIVVKPRLTPEQKNQTIQTIIWKKT